MFRPAWEVIESGDEEEVEEKARKEGHGTDRTSGGGAGNWGKAGRTDAEAVLRSRVSCLIITFHF